jgi:predicted deacylase
LSGPAKLDLALDEPGRRWGALTLPWSRDDSAYGQLVIPVAVVHGRRPGKTVLLTAGVHGDEFEGQITLLELARELEPDAVAGRVIIVPAANLPAARAGRRTSPVDGGNLARLFPGDPAGGLTSAIAEGIVRLLLPHADILLDLHGGGRSLDYLPCAWGRLPADRTLAERVVDGLCALGAPLTALVVPAENRGTLVVTALEMGKVALATEIGGGGTLTPVTLAVARNAVRRVLAHTGVQPALVPTPTRLLAVRPHHFLRSPGRGLFAPAASLGDEVQAGDLAGHLHDLDQPSAAPAVLRWPVDGLVLCRRVSPQTEPGDVLAHLAEDVTRGGLLSHIPV